MTWDDLLCAACSGRVIDGGCATCRLSRRQLPSRGPLPAQALLITALVVLIALLLLT